MTEATYSHQGALHRVGQWVPHSRGWGMVGRLGALLVGWLVARCLADAGWQFPKINNTPQP